MRAIKLLTTLTTVASCVSLVSAQSASSTGDGTSSGSSSSSKKGKTAASTVDPTVAFLQSLQQAQVSSMNCLITLVNMTAQPVGECLSIAELATILYPVEGNQGAATASQASSKTAKAKEKRQSPDTPEVPAAAPAAGSSSSSSGSASGSGSKGKGAKSAAASADGFAGDLESWLGTICKGAACNSADLEEGRAELASKCASQMKAEGGFVPMLDAMMANYAASYRTLACSVHYNGTAENCVTSALASSPASNSPTFFIDLLSGINLAQYTTSVFNALPCTGCVHELYKAAIFLIPAIRGQQLTQNTGGHLQDTCGEGPPNWDTIMDEAMPEALTVKQSIPSASFAVRGFLAPTSSWLGQYTNERGSWGDGMVGAAVLAGGIAMLI